MDRPLSQRQPVERADDQPAYLYGPRPPAPPPRASTYLGQTPLASDLPRGAAAAAVAVAVGSIPTAEPRPRPSASLHQQADPMDVWQNGYHHLQRGPMSHEPPHQPNDRLPFHELATKNIPLPIYRSQDIADGFSDNETSTNILPPLHTNIIHNSNNNKNNNSLVSNVPLQRHFRQLPSMTTVINNSNKFVDYPLQHQDLGFAGVSSLPNPLASPSSAANLAACRRSLPPMANVGRENKNQAKLYEQLPANSQRNSLINDSINYNNRRTSEASSTISTGHHQSSGAMRKLPVVTPYGPQTILQPSSRLPFQDGEICEL